MLINKFKTNMARAAEYYVKDSGKFSTYTAALTHAYYYTLQTSAFAHSKNIPDDKKRFVVLQEVGEGSLVVASTILLGTKLKEIGEKLVDKAKLVPWNLPENLRNPESVKAILDGKLTSAELSKIDLPRFKSLMGLGCSLIGVIISYALITPVIRNKFANYFNNKEKNNKNTVPIQSVFEKYESLKALNNNANYSSQFKKVG